VLSAFEGTLIFVSHDRYLIDALAQQIWALEEGRMTRYDGNYSAYAEGRAPRLDRPDAPMPARAPRTATSPEEELIELQQEAADLSSQIAEQGGTASVARLSEMLNRFAETEARLQEAQQAWLRQIREQVRASSG
jgi:ATP-binding cassette subfamily F protein 3